MKTKEFTRRIKLDDRINGLLENIEYQLESNINRYGLISIPFEPRLLESILLASYFQNYYRDTELHKLAIETLNKVYTLVIPSISRVPALDNNIQKLLFDLFQGEYTTEYLGYWYSQYQSLLDKSFQSDTNTNRIKKNLFFDSIAIFCCPNEEIKQTLLSLVLDNFSQILPLFVKKFQQDKKSHWNAIYPILFQLITQKFEKGDFLSCLHELIELQSDNGTWFQNHTLTLVVLHTIRLYDISVVNELTQEILSKAEFYLKGYLPEGLSIIRSMNIFNTCLYFSQKSYFNKTIIPKKLIQTLIDLQKTDGGWSSDTGLGFTDWDATGFAILSLLNQSSNIDLLHPLEYAYDFLKRMMSDDGSFKIYSSGSETLAEMTSRGIMVLSSLPSWISNERDHLSLIYKSFISLAKKQEKNGLFLEQSYSASSLYPLSQVALAIYYVRNSGILENTPNSEELIINLKKIISGIEDKILKYIYKVQNPNGSFSSKPLFPLFGEQQSTAYAIIALACLQPGSPTHLNSLSYLLSSIDNLPSSFVEGTGPRPIRYNDKSHGLIFVHLALLVSKWTITH